MRLLITFALSWMALHVCAATSSNEELGAAQAVIVHYKELRKVCSIARGDDRKECFRELTEATDNYQQAKIIVRDAKDKEVRELHVVTNVY
ncbi:hypothetical protein SAMN02745866_03298 [Alteromonadaceae bacterium Bs31]|nr:hypothetical protein SAMN02745866_03298 [Alteromonadaceae bacterium Bs31]